MRKPYTRPAVRTLRAFYTIGELAEMAGVSKYRLVVQLRAEGVQFRTRRRGAPTVVCLSQIKKAWPDLWDSLIEKAVAERS